MSWDVLSWNGYQHWSTRLSPIYTHFQNDFTVHSSPQMRMNRKRCWRVSNKYIFYQDSQTVLIPSPAGISKFDTAIRAWRSCESVIKNTWIFQFPVWSWNKAAFLSLSRSPHKNQRRINFENWQSSQFCHPSKSRNTFWTKPVIQFPQSSNPQLNSNAWRFKYSNTKYFILSLAGRYGKTNVTAVILFFANAERNTFVNSSII